ncbi:hypothetical protein ACFWTE_24305 [Nocardiopsis sp. NPDC058631]
MAATRACGQGSALTAPYPTTAAPSTVTGSTSAVPEAPRTGLRALHGHG